MPWKFQQIPSLSDEIKAGPIFVLAIEYELVLIPFNMMLAFMSGASFVFIKLIYRDMSSRTLGQSQHTVMMQKKFLKAIYAQVFVFLLNFGLPMAYIVSSVLTNYRNQAGNNMVFVLIALHGISSTVIMLWAHKPYREVCQRFVNNLKRLMGLSVSSSSVVLPKPSVTVF